MDYMIFPNNLREVRIEKQRSQDNVAKATGISRSTVANIEAGRQEPSIVKAYYIAAYLDEPLLKIFPFEKEVQIK
ncbi:MAG: helix-turn-helix domain-containing protein [Lachnospiraceae bacterium]|nr:helix-turn-helix domain-containing protein [Lachnospiraceae bacterium]